MKGLALLVLGVSVGALGAWWLRPAAPPVAAPLEAKLRGFAENELKAYAEADSAEEKLRRADALYEKAVLLFLADLGLRVTLPPKAPSVEQLVADAAGDAPMEEGDPAVGPKAPAPVRPMPIPAPAPAAKPLTPEEKAIANQLAFKRAPYANSMTPQVQRLVGQFEGVLAHQVGRNKGRRDGISMAIDLHMTDKLEGNVLILLSEPSGKIYSRSSGDGNNQTIKLVPGRRDQAWVVPAPGDAILFDLRNEDLLRGVYHSQGEPVGQVTVWRK